MKPFIRYLIAKISEGNETKTYREYISETLWLYFAKNKAMKTSYIDLVRKSQKPEPEKSGDEIALEVIEKLGLKPMNRG